jgi:formylglycine-generating enzyme required for sulfatase activity
MDIDSIPFGVNFRDHIDAAVGQCDVFLAVIGPKWLGRTKARRRLDNPKDFVRIELESALHRSLPVIPILIDHAKMPGEADLPSSLASLAFFNAIEVDQGRDFHPHVDRLIRGIEFFFQQSSTAAVEPRTETIIRAAKPAPEPPQPMRKVTNSLGMTFVRLEAGEFLMGTTEDQVDQLMGLFPNSNREWFDAEQPQHPVTISRPFFLGIHQVTQGQYLAVTGNNPSKFKGSDDLPVERVSWLDALNFCNKLSEREQRTPFYRITGAQVTVAGGEGYRLPTEAEWEYACRARSATLYPFGDEASKLDEHAWYTSNAEGKTHPVGRKSPNHWALHDMLGNVWEWCDDGYHEKYYASSPPADPAGASGASRRVIRGGCWGNSPGGCRPAFRFGRMPGSEHDDLGFRIATVQE